jgi:hypothetical protein
VADLGVVDVGEPVDERLQAGRIGVLRPPVIDVTGHKRRHRLPEHRTGHPQVPCPLEHRLRMPYRVRGGSTRSGREAPRGGHHRLRRMCGPLHRAGTAARCSVPRHRLRHPAHPPATRHSSFQPRRARRPHASPTGGEPPCSRLSLRVTSASLAPAARIHRFSSSRRRALAPCPAALLTVLTTHMETGSVTAPRTGRRSGGNQSSRPRLLRVRSGRARRDRNNLPNIGRLEPAESPMGFGTPSLAG